MKLSLYPKTKRIGYDNSTVIVTEKLDGSNLGFFKLNGDILIAQRNNMFKLSELEECKKELYKGLYGWLVENGENLKKSLNETSGVFGEWIGMGKLKYENLNKRFYIFAKSNLNEDMTTKNIIYNPEFFKYPFTGQEIPKYMGIVKVVSKLDRIPSIIQLDELYEKYTAIEDRNVEGFVINNNDKITKYIRMKGGRLTDHKA